MGKSAAEIEEMRKKKFEKQFMEKRKAGQLKEDEMARGAALPPMEDKLLPPASGDKGRPGKKKAAGTGKAVKIKCPKCDKIQNVTSTQRPLDILCSNCGMKLVLKK